VPRGFAPYKTSTISPADHQITVRSTGYVDRVMTVRTYVGYRLTVFAKLARGEPGPDGASTKIEPPKVYVQILDTPTGFLRVRTQAGTAGEEIAEVKPGSKYPYLSEDSSLGWYEIQYEEPKPGLPDGIKGWVSSQYSKKVEELTATPSASLDSSN
jgi:hypothetical protein